MTNIPIETVRSPAVDEKVPLMVISSPSEPEAGVTEVT